MDPSWTLAVIGCVCHLVISSQVALDNHCDGQIIVADADMLVISNWTSVRMRVTCRVNVTSQASDPAAYHVFFSVLDLHTGVASQQVTWGESRGLTGGAEPCLEVRLDLFDAITGHRLSPEAGLCGQNPSVNQYVSRHGTATVMVTYNATSNRTSEGDRVIKLLAVPFHDRPCNGMFECDNARCVAASLQCNGDDDCGDDSDETDGCLTSTPVVIAVVVVSSFLVAVVFVWLLVRYYRTASNKFYDPFSEGRLITGAACINDDLEGRSDVRRKLQGRVSQSYGAT